MTGRYVEEKAEPVDLGKVEGVEFNNIPTTGRTAYNRRYYFENRERITSHRKQYYLENRERILSRVRRRYDEQYRLSTRRNKLKRQIEVLLTDEELVSEIFGV